MKKNVLFVLLGFFVGSVVTSDFLEQKLWSNPYGKELPSGWSYISEEQIHLECSLDTAKGELKTTVSEEQKEHLEAVIKLLELRLRHEKVLK
jgi:hypothetical protein